MTQDAPGDSADIKQVFMVDHVTGGQQKSIRQIRDALGRSLQGYLRFCNAANRIRRSE